MSEEKTLIIILLIALVGVGIAIIYYFGRFAFKPDEDDEPRLEESPKSFAETLDTQVLKDQPKTSHEVFETPLPEKVEPPLSAETAVESERSLFSALAKTKEQLFGRIQRAFTSTSERAEVVEAIEEILFTSDIGPKTVTHLLESLEIKSSTSFEDCRRQLKLEMEQILASNRLGLDGYRWSLWEEQLEQTSGPFVLLVVGVNGAGKTTSIGKMAHHFASQGKKVLVAAGDTFRAGAGQQLRVWSERAQVEIFAPEEVKDPSAVAFDACQKAVAKDFDLVIIDTAGRLHTQVPLMEELKKIKRVIQKVISEAPHETLLVLDANSGQNALIQAAQFHEAVGVSGVLLSKLDSTAKGGVVLGLANELRLPVYLAGVGEKMTDLKEFNPREFVDSII